MARATAHVKRALTAWLGSINHELAELLAGSGAAGAAAGLRQTQDAMRRKAAGGRAVRLKPEIYRVDP